MSTYGIVAAIERLIDAKIRDAANESCDPIYQQEINKASADLESALWDLKFDE